MSDAARLHALKQIAELIRDRDIARLAKAQSRKAGTEALLRALDQGQAPENLGTAAEGQVIARHGLWMSNRRIALNQQLARDTAAWMGARDEAQRAFGRAEVLKDLLLRK